MLKKLSAWFHRLSKGWVAITALVIFLLFTLLVLPGQASSGSPAGGTTASPDLSLYYSAADLNRMAEAYGEQGRQDYVRARFTFDLAWPLVYTFFLLTGTSWLFARGFAPGEPWQRLNLLPLFAFLFDLLENLLTSLVMIAYPHLLPLAASLAGPATLVKWLLVSASFALLLAGAGAALWRWAKGRGRQ